MDMITALCRTVILYFLIMIAPFLFQYGQLMGFYTASRGQTA